MKNEAFAKKKENKRTSPEQFLKQSLHQPLPAVNHAHLYATILLVQKEVCRKQRQQHISFARFLGKMIPAIGWKLWFLQGIFLLAFYGYGFCFDPAEYLQSPPRLAKRLFCLSIAVFMTALPLLYRSVRWRMQEIEAAAHFSSVKLLLAKLIVVGIGDISLLSGIFLATVVKTPLPADTAVLYLCIPFLLACAGCLFMLGHFPPDRFLSGSLLFCTALLLTFSVLPAQCAFLFQPSFSAARIILCALLFTFCAQQLRYLIKVSSYEELQLN